MGTLLALEGAVAQGLLYAIMTLGVYITYKLLDFADLTVDGSFALGGCVSAILITVGLDPFTSLLIATLAGDGSGRVDMDLSGGEGFYISNGTYETITWKKGNTPSNPLKLYDKNGNELVLNAGKSWIGLLPENYSENTVIA